MERVRHAGVYLAAALVVGLTFLPTHTPDPWPAALLAPVVFVSIVLSPRLPWPLLALPFLVWPVNAALWPVNAVAGYTAANTLSGLRHVLGYGCGITVVFLAPELINQLRFGLDTEQLGATCGVTVIFGWGPILFGLLLKARREVVAGLRARTAQLEREQTARTEQARAQERARIARDMHDVVAHRVSLMVLHAGALETGTFDEHSAAQARLIGTAGREALAQLREVLGVLKEAPGELAPPATLAELDLLLNESRLVGVPVVRMDLGDPRPLPIMVQNTAHRVVREALTNVHKHAGLVHTEIRMTYHPDALEVQVSNEPGLERADRLPGSGLGLIGMTERVKLLGGGLDFGSTAGGGFRVRAWLPTGEPA
ncbi:hypothetical protein GCM10027088_39710 [Nocardia goodfellowii]